MTIFDSRVCSTSGENIRPVSVRDLPRVQLQRFTKVCKAVIEPGDIKASTDEITESLLPQITMSKVQLLRKLQ